MAKDRKTEFTPNQTRNYRLEAGLHQSDVAFLLDIKNVGRISEWENGLSNPGIEHLLSLGIIYNRLPDELYYELRKKLVKKIELRRKLLLEAKAKRAGASEKSEEHQC